MPALGMPTLIQRLLVAAVVSAVCAGILACQVEPPIVLAEIGDADAQYDQGNKYSEDGNYAEAYKWFRRAAEQEHADAQYELGIMYLLGEYVPKDSAEAVKWFRLAAEQGDAQAKFQLGVMYDMGLGVPQNNIEAHKWANLAAAQSQGDVYNIYAEFRDAIAEEITPEELAQAQRLARKWQPDRSESHTGTDSYLTETPERNTPLKISPAGTGFVVSSASLLLTNHHVIEGCRAVTVRMEGKDSQLAVLASDEANDLALLKLAKKVSAAASFRLGTGPRPGDSVTVVGFPLNQDFHFGPGTATVYTRSAPNSTSFHAEPCTSPLLVVARAGSTAHSR